MSSDHNCEFCELNGRDSDYFLFRTEFWTAYLADNQNYPGRCIIPLNRHIPTLASVGEDEWEDLRHVVKILEAALTDVLGVTNFNWTCLMNGGYASHPYNPHLHLHLIPRYDHDLENFKQPFHDELFGNHYTMSSEYQLNEDERHKLISALRSRIIEDVL